MRYPDCSPWGPAAISLTFVVLAVGAYVQIGGLPGGWVVISLSGLVAAWQAREAVHRYLAADERDDRHDRDEGL